VSHQEQLSLTLRFVNIKRKIEVKEHFIGFKTVESSTGLSLTDLLLKTLAEKNIPFQDCRGQGYNSGSNIKGQKKGVQARVLSINPRATFVSCNCHSLN